MKINKKRLIVILIIISLLIFIVMLLKKVNQYKELYVLTQNPFSKISILNQNVILNNTDRLYIKSVDCNNLTPNEQIVYFTLKESKENYKVSVFINIYENNKLLTDNYEKATNIETRLIVKDSNKQYEQIYVIESICQRGDLT